MDRPAIIDRLLANEVALKAHGVIHAALFGSRAHGEPRSDSDTDIMIEIDPAAGIGVYEYVGLKDYIASLFDGPVELMNRDGLEFYVAPADAIYAARRETLDQAFQDNPQRFVNKTPMPPDKPTEVWINPPKVRSENRV